MSEKNSAIRTMVSISEFRSYALALPGAIELPHFDRTSFRGKKKIFATLSEKDNTGMVSLSPQSQSVFCAFDETVFYPVPGGWGKKGATYINLAKVKKAMLKDALKTAYSEKVSKQ
jgi:hypothetical protein